MAERAEQDRTQANTATAAAPAAASGGWMATIQAMLARGTGTPAHVASVMRANPHLQRDIVAFLQSALGNSFVQAVVKMLSAPASEPAPKTAPKPKSYSISPGPARVTATGLNVRRSPDASSTKNIVGGLQHGATVNVLVHDAEWLLIEYQDGTAYIHGDYVESLAKPKPAETAVASSGGTPPAAHAAPAVHEHAELAQHDAKPAAVPAHAETPVAPAPEVAHPVTPHPEHDPKATAPAAPQVAAQQPHADAKAAAPAAVAKPEVKPTPPKAQGAGYVKYGGGTVREALTKLANAGALKITGKQIALLDAVAQVETGGQIGCVQTYDDQIVSVGFKQVVLGWGSLEKVMQKAPAGFAKHGITLDASKTYVHDGWPHQPHQIAGCSDVEQLRGAEWAMKFYAASMEPDVIVAMAELALGEAGKVEAEIGKSAAGVDLFTDPTAEGWLLETMNNRPAFLPKAIQRAVADGAKAEKDRDKFLDILGHAIVETYATEEPLLYYQRAKHAHKGPMTPEQDAALRAEMIKKYEPGGRHKATNIITKISRHLEVPKVAGDKSASASGTPAPAPAAKPAVQATPAPVDEPVHVPPEITHTPAPAPHAAPTTAPAPVAPVAHTAPAPAPVAQPAHAPTAHPAPAAAHVEAAKAAPAPAPSPAAHATPAPAPVAHATPAAVAPALASTPHAAPGPGTAPTQSPSTAPAAASAQLANVDAAPAHVEGKAISKVLKLPRPLPQVHAFLPPGGAKGNAEVFLFLHGMFAYHERSHDKGFRPGRDINDPNPDEAMNLAGAMAATRRNLVTLAPVAHYAGEWPLWRELAENKGFQELIIQSLDQLSTELSITPPLSVGSISIAGHSAGGSALGAAAKQLGDKIHDMTYEDGGYADKPGQGSGWKDSHDKVAAWLLDGDSDKLLRVLLHGEHNRLESTILHSHFNKESIEQTAKKLNKQGVIVTREEGNHDKRSPDKGMYLDHTLHVQGLPGVRTVTVFNLPNANHMQLRDRSTQHLITEGRDTQFESDTAAPAGPLKAAGAMPVEAHSAGQTPHRESPKPEAPHSAPPAAASHPIEAKAAAPKPPHVEPTAAAAPAGAVQAVHPVKGYDRDKKTNLDSFGNPTERVSRTEKNLTGDNHRVFTNQFTTVSKAPLVTRDLKDARRSLEKGAILHTYAVNGTYAQIVSSGITLEDNLWISFQYLGGDGSTKPAFGNEKADEHDKVRADAIRDQLPKSGRKPGASKHHWRFTGAFLPSSDGIALDGSLMSKVNALMEWAIAEDMITEDIEIRSGVRPPLNAHKMCIRFQLAYRDGAHVDFDAIRKLPDGKYHGWKFCPVPGKSTDEEIKKQAHVLYQTEGGSGAQAAAGFAPGTPGRSPLKDSGPGVSKHCPGHAVDVRIPWRSEKNPEVADLWAWEEIYHQFGLTRPLHKDRGFSGHDAEHWHIEETGKELAGAETEGGGE